MSKSVFDGLENVQGYDGRLSPDAARRMEVSARAGIVVWLLARLGIVAMIVGATWWLVQTLGGG